MSHNFTVHRAAKGATPSTRFMRFSISFNSTYFLCLGKREVKLYYYIVTNLVLRYSVVLFHVSSDFTTSDWKIPLDESRAAALPHWKLSKLLLLLLLLLLLHCILFKSCWPSAAAVATSWNDSDFSRFSSWWYDMSTSAFRFRNSACSISSEFFRMGSCMCIGQMSLSSIEHNSSKFSKSNFLSTFFGEFWFFCCVDSLRKRENENWF